MALDEVDCRILRALSRDARMPTAHLARELGLSAPATADRVRRLEDAGVIRGYAARVDPQALGLPVSAYLRIKPLPGVLPKVADLLRELECVVSCDRITGEDCFLAKAHVASVSELEALIDRILPYASTNTSIIQSSPVEPRLPRFGPEAGGRSVRRRAT